jgi:hypothetical protein
MRFVNQLLWELACHAWRGCKCYGSTKQKAANFRRLSLPALDHLPASVSDEHLQCLYLLWHSV